MRVASVAPMVGDTVDPQRRSSQTFAHYSIPAFDERQEPVIELGSEIKSNKTAFPRGAVLFSKLNPRISRVWLVDDEQEVKRICSTEFLPLLPDRKRCEARYLAWMLRSPTFVNSIAGPSAATKSRERIKPDDLMGAQIPLPPVLDQRRIADRLDAAMTDLAGARRALARQRQELLALSDARACELFQRLASVVGWKRLGDASPDIEYGYTASAEERDGPRLLRITDVKASGVDWSSVPGCSINPADLHRKRLKDGDIVVARTGGTVGKSFLVKNPPEAVFASYLVRVRAVGEHHPAYLHHFLQTSLYWNALRASARGGAQPNVNASLLKEIPLPLPSGCVQRDIVAKLNEFVTEAANATAILDRQAEAFDALGPSLLNAAFQGKL